MRAGEKYRQKAQLLLAQAELIREPAGLVRAVDYLDAARARI